jgi:hypothetical protein
MSGRKQEEYAMLKPPGQRAREIHPDDLLVQFLPDMTRQFAQLEAMVNQSEQVEPETLLTLTELASGKPLLAKEAFFWVAKIVEETSNHIHVTGDQRAQESLSNLMSCMWDLEKEPGYAPFTFSKSIRRANER